MTEERQEQDTPRDRGRNATRPGDIPAQGWRDVLIRVKRRITDDNLYIVAAGVAFYALIATFPGLLALLQVYGLVFEPGQVAEQLNFLTRQLEPEAINVVVFLVRGLGESDRARLGFGIAGGALVTLWGASLGLRALMRALNVAYGEREKRSAFVRYGLSLVLTAGAISAAFCMALVLLSLPLLTCWLELSPLLQRLVFYARWPMVGALFWLSLLVFYRYAPSRASARWSWVSWGALLATSMWLAGTGVLAWYVAGSRRYHEGYGSVGHRRAAAGLVSRLCLLGPPRRRGQRRARAADRPGHHGGRRQACRFPGRGRRRHARRHHVPALSG